MGKEFFTLTLSKMGSSMFPGGIPIDLTLHVQNGSFNACGEIMAASLTQGGPAPLCLDASVYDLMVNLDVSFQEINSEIHLTASDRDQIDSILKDVIAKKSAVDANCLFSIMCPEFTEAGSTQKEIEEWISCRISGLD